MKDLSLLTLHIVCYGGRCNRLSLEINAIWGDERRARIQKKLSNEKWTDIETGHVVKSENISASNSKIICKKSPVTLNLGNSPYSPFRFVNWCMNFVTYIMWGHAGYYRNRARVQELSNKWPVLKWTRLDMPRQLNDDIFPIEKSSVRKSLNVIWVTREGKRPSGHNERNHVKITRKRWRVIWIYILFNNYWKAKISQTWCLSLATTTVKIFSYNNEVSL